MHFASLLTIFILLISSLPATAQENGGYCDAAQSTAEALTCVNRQKQAAQDRLTGIFEDLMQTQDEAGQKQLLESQKAWISYRDAKCAWEAGLAEADSLERVYELSCISALTEERAGDLATVMTREYDQAGPREFGGSARWTNVLKSEHPDIFWQTGHSVRTDLNCDGQPEEIMAGLDILDLAAELAAATEPETSGEAENYSMTAVVAIADNPVTGRPAIELVTLPVSEVFEGDNNEHDRDKGQAALCSASISLTAMSLPAVKPEHDEGAAMKENISVGDKTCGTSLKVTDMMCRSYQVYWAGREYAVSPL